MTRQELINMLRRLPEGWPQRMAGDMWQADCNAIEALKAENERLSRVLRQYAAIEDGQARGCE